MKKKKSFNFKAEYKKSLDYIKKARNFIWISVLIFLVFALIGFFLPTPVEIKEQILKYMQEIVEKTKDMQALELINFIFFNNLKSSASIMVFGVLLGIFPVIAALVNGYIIGFVLKLSVQSDGFLSLWRLLPHGIFELPAVFISLGLGIKLGLFIFYRKKSEGFLNCLINSFRVFILIVLPLLIIAAIIEGIFIFLG